MKRSEQNGRNAPRQGTLARASQSGVVGGYIVPAISRFPPPEFLTDTQRNLWIAALSDVPLEFFRTRHIPMMIQYVRAVEHMMRFSDEFEADPEDLDALNKWDRMSKIAARLERHLSFNAEALISMVLRARSEFRVATQQKNLKEAGEDERNARSGLTYVGY